MHHGGGWWSYLRYDEQKDRPHINRHLLMRVVETARPYWVPALVTLFAILVISLLGLIPPLLIRELIDTEACQRWVDRFGSRLQWGRGTAIRHCSARRTGRRRPGPGTWHRAASKARDFRGQLRSGRQCRSCLESVFHSRILRFFNRVWTDGGWIAILSRPKNRMGGPPKGHLKQAFSHTLTP